MLQPAPRLIPGLTTDARGAHCWTVAVRPGISSEERDAWVVATGQFIFSTGARAQARKLVGGWARRARAEKKNKS